METVEASKEVAEEFHRLQGKINGYELEIMRLDFLLQMAYCQKVGTDTPQGLSCCDDFRDWIAGLEKINPHPQRNWDKGVFRL
jgi:hypothetical protein